MRLFREKETKCGKDTTPEHGTKCEDD